MNAILSFTPQKASHRPMLLSPYYARTNRDDQRPQIHEYRHADFMELFAEDLAKNRLQASRDQAWFTANRLDGKRWPQLRQPIHRGFYLAASELACDSRSRAPVEPSRVREAWILVSPFGKGFTTAGMKPRQRRLLIQAQLARAIEAGMAFPARPEVVEDERGRGHTILAGHLSIADIVSNESREQVQDEEQLESSAVAMGENFAPADFTAGNDEVLWNGTALIPRPGADSVEIPPRLASLVQLLDENLALGVDAGSLVDVANLPGDAGRGGISELSEWLDSVYFYRIPGDNRSATFRDRQQSYRVQRNRLVSNLQPSLPAGVTRACRDAHAALRQAIQSVTVPGMTPRKLAFVRIHHYTPERIAGYTTPWTTYLDALAPLVDALRLELGRPQNLAVSSQLRNALNDLRTALLNCRSAATALDNQFLPRNKYRENSLLDWYVAERKDQDLSLTEQLPAQQKLIVTGSWVAEGAALISNRWRAMIDVFTADWQSSQQASLLTRDDDQLYQLMMVALVAGDDGCEYIAHSAPGEPFSIASHYETRLMPTYPIKMPTLKDLKKAVRGPAMIMPPDLADEVNKLKFPDGEVEQSGSGGGGIQWITIFSIPIVTICAMILLMLMINILNFIFRWLPFAILRIPFPK